MITEYRTQKSKHRSEEPVMMHQNLYLNLQKNHKTQSDPKQPNARVLQEPVLTKEEFAMLTF